MRRPYTLSNLGVTHELRGDFGLAREMNLEALHVAEQTGQREIQVGILNNLVACAVEPDDFALGLEHSARAMRLATTIGAIPMMLQSLLHRAELCGRIGDDATAEPLLRVVCDHPAAVDSDRACARELLMSLGAPNPGSSVGGSVDLHDAEALERLARSLS